MRGLLAVIILISLLTYSSCRNSDRDRDTSTESAEVFWMSTNHFNNIMREVHRVAMVDSVINGINPADAIAPQICLDSFNRTPIDGPFPIDLTIYYSEENTCSGVRNRSGKIHANIDGIYSNLGTKINITTTNYSVDGYSVSAEISMEVIYQSKDTVTYDVWIKNGKLVDRKNKNFVTKQEGHLNFSHYQGTKTVTTTDDAFYISGSGNGIAQNGVIYTFQSEDVTILSADCEYETFGSYRLIAPNQLDRVCEFGEGGGCDNIMLVSIPPANGDEVVQIP
jgi:hypothetical protein